MFHVLANRIKEKYPKFNQTIMEGFHQKEFEGALRYYENALRIIFKSIESRGVFFRGVTKVPPREFIDYLINSSTKVYDIHKETIYPVKLAIDYQDKSGQLIRMHAYTMLPYCDKYGDMWLRGVHYSLQIVLAERGLPVTKENSLFVKVLGFKFKIGTENFNYDYVFQHGNQVMTSTASINLACNRFYSPTAARKITSKTVPIPLLAWYVFANIGFTEAMRRYGECEYELGPVEALLSECKTKDRWEIITRSKAENHKYLGEAVVQDLGIALRNISASRKTLNNLGLQYAASLQFVIDCMGSYFDESRIDDPDYWKLLIGRTSVKSGDSNEAIMRLMYNHFDSINDYLDEDSIKKFRNHNIVASDIFDLFNYIITNRSEIVQTTDRASMFHKELSSLEFTMDKLITAANNFKHDIKNNSELSQKKVSRFLNSRFHAKEIDNARSTNLIQEATPTDVPFVDYMLGCIPQDKVFTSSSKNKKKGDFDAGDSSTHIHASQLFVNSHLKVSSPCPDGRAYLLPCIYLHGKVTGLNPKHAERFAKAEKRLKTREIRNGGLD